MSDMIRVVLGTDERTNPKGCYEPVVGKTWVRAESRLCPLFIEFSDVLLDPSNRVLAETSVGVECGSSRVPRSDDGEESCPMDKLRG